MATAIPGSGAPGEVDPFAEFAAGRTDDDLFNDLGGPDDFGALRGRRRGRGRKARRGTAAGRVHTDGDDERGDLDGRADPGTKRKRRGAPPGAEAMARPWRLSLIGAGLAIALVTRLFIANGVGSLLSDQFVFTAATTSLLTGLGLVLLAGERDRFGSSLILFTLLTAGALAVVQWISPHFGADVLEWDTRSQVTLTLLGFGNGLLVAGIVALALARRLPTLAVVGALGAGVLTLLVNTVLLRREWPAILILAMAFGAMLLAWDQTPRHEPVYRPQQDAPRVSRAVLGLASIAFCGAAIQLWLSRGDDVGNPLPAVGLAVALAAIAFFALIGVRREIQNRETTLSEWTSWMREIRTGDLRTDFENLSTTASGHAIGDLTAEPPRPLSFPNLRGAQDLRGLELASPPLTTSPAALPVAGHPDDQVAGTARAAETAHAAETIRATETVRYQATLAEPNRPKPPRRGGRRSFSKDDLAWITPDETSHPGLDEASIPVPPLTAPREDRPERSDIGHAPAAPTIEPVGDTPAPLPAITSLPAPRETTPTAPPAGPISTATSSPATSSPATSSPATSWPATSSPATSSTATSSPAGGSGGSGVGAFSGAVSTPATMATMAVAAGPGSADDLGAWLAATASAPSRLLVAVETMSLASYDTLTPDSAAAAVSGTARALAALAPAPTLVARIDGPYLMVAWQSVPTSDYGSINNSVLAILADPGVIGTEAAATGRLTGTLALLRPAADAGLDTVIDEAITGLIRARELAVVPRGS